MKRILPTQGLQKQSQLRKDLAGPKGRAVAGQCREGRTKLAEGMRCWFHPFAIESSSPSSHYPIGKRTLSGKKWKLCTRHSIPPPVATMASSFGVATPDRHNTIDHLNQKFTMGSIAPSTLNVDDMLMGEILMSLKQGNLTSNTSGNVTPSALKLEHESATYRNKMTNLSVEVPLPSPVPVSPDGNSRADAFNLDIFNVVSPMAYPLPLGPPVPTSPQERAMTVTPRGGSKRFSPVVKLEDLRECFNMPIAAVARKFGICATLLKKICRRHGIQRWPHRQIRSLQKSIDMLRESLGVAKGTNKEYIAKKIAAFEYTLECIMRDPNTAAKGISTGRLASPATEEMVKRGNRVKSRKKTVSPMAQAALSDGDDDTRSSTVASRTSFQQDRTADDGAANAVTQRLSTRRASLPMSIQSILC
ncbi:hypothetical protein PsorP6_012767 [Peronosclerospora sorghi]|uniref:Uncharacterized protein n=1 Tax=Peronosclerospora sorghi TaxID=230839 RepID=A0ACC0WJC6_9STRA|nr:hypothetical protein PsorP6_012767 [Peronosclerospora sorghi]